MIKRVLLILFLMGISGCWYGPAVNTNYDFEMVGKINIDEVRDHSNLSGSGEMVQRQWINLLKPMPAMKKQKLPPAPQQRPTAV